MRVARTSSSSMASSSSSSMCLMIGAASLLLLLSSSFPAAEADVYLHNPRGSNNRLKGQNRDRSNANRMFDSQNNNRGGYNVGEGSLTYYEGSNLQVSN